MNGVSRTKTQRMETQVSEDFIEVPNVDDASVAFGTTIALPDWDDIPEEFKSSANPFSKAASMIFFKGGRLADYGLRVKKDLDSDSVHRALQAHLCSFEPKHEHKEAGVGYLMFNWCEQIPPGNPDE